jgi:probable rRNA maturation factor
MTSAPTIRVRNSQRKVRVELPRLQTFAREALRAALQMKPRGRGGLHELEEVHVILVSDARIAALHEQFMQIAGPTDVITFQHGDIFISTETAQANSRRFGSSTDAEIRLYIAHGILHLLGFDDTTAAAARLMAKAQDRLVRAAEAAM